MLNKEAIESLLDVRLPVTVYNELESTNQTAREIAQTDDKREQVIIARQQSCGRGRLGRAFYSPQGGLYMSFILRPRLNARKALEITTAAAVAVARAIDSVAGTRCEIKWVNDVYIGSKKVCGILTESAICKGDMIDFAILGIGVNLCTPVGGFPKDIADTAGALFETLPEGADNLLAAKIVDEFMSLFYKSSRDERLSEYRSRSNLIGRDVNITSIIGGASTPAHVCGIGEDFSLIVEYQNGKKEALSSGEVSVRERR